MPNSTCCCKEVFEGRGVGWKSAAKGRADLGVNGGAQTPRRRRADADGGLFEVYEAPAGEGNDALAHMLGEDASAPQFTVSVCVRHL